MASTAQTDDCNNTLLFEDSGTQLSLSEISFLKNCSAHFSEEYELENETMLSNSTSFSLRKEFSILNLRNSSQSQNHFACSSLNESWGRFSLTFSSNYSEEIVDMIECELEDHEQMGTFQAKVNVNLLDDFDSLYNSEQIFLRDGEVTSRETKLDGSNYTDQKESSVVVDVTLKEVVDNNYTSCKKNSLKSTHSIKSETANQKMIKPNENNTRRIGVAIDQSKSVLNEDVIQENIDNKSRSRCYVVIKESPNEKNVGNDQIINNSNETYKKKKNIYKTFFKKPTVIPDYCKSEKVVRWPFQQKVCGEVVPTRCLESRTIEENIEAVRRSERLTRSLLGGEPRMWPILPWFPSRRRKTATSTNCLKRTASPNLGRFKKSIRPRLRNALINAISSHTSVEKSLQELAATLEDLGITDTILSFYQFIMTYTPPKFQMSALPLKGFFNCNLPIRKSTISEPAFIKTYSIKKLRNS